MTRIIAGRFGGHRLGAPSSGTRPTSDRVREAVFSALTVRMDFEAMTVLDLCAGTGALGLEALSRGADHAILVDSAATAVSAIRQNALKLGAVESSSAHDISFRVIRAETDHFLSTATPPAGGVDLVFCDPPYELASSVLPAVSAALLQYEWLTEDPLVVFEYSSREKVSVVPEAANIAFERQYGDTSISIFSFPDM